MMCEIYKILLYKQIVTLQEANSKFSHSSLCQGWIHQKNIVCLYDLTFLHTAASARVAALHYTLTILLFV